MAARRATVRTVRKSNSPGLRSVSGVVTTIIGLVIIFFVGAICFNKIFAELELFTLSPEWENLLYAVYDWFGLGLNILFFIFILCIITPVLWIFLGRRRGDQL